MVPFPIGLFSYQLLTVSKLHMFITEHQLVDETALEKMELRGMR